MSKFHKYVHLERFGTSEVEGIEDGVCHVFPKLDGTNASVWLEDGQVMAGSRNRHLSLEADNAGFYAWVKTKDEMFREFFSVNPNVTLYGEWLVPHTLKTYREESWRDFYMFDVWDHELQQFMDYEQYLPLVKDSGITYLSPIAIIRNGDEDTFRKSVDMNTVLIKDGEGVGEGVVIKNYDFVNRYGRTTWAKMVTNSFKESHVKTMGPPEIGGVTTEEKIVDEYVTQHLVDKVHAKISLEDGWHSKLIGKLLGVVWHDLITEEIWDILKKHKNPKVDFKRLQRLTIQKTKELRGDLF